MSRNIEAPKRRTQEFRSRDKAGKIIPVKIISPDYSKDPRLNLPPGGLGADAPRLNFSEPIWVAPHLRKPSWKKR
nr:hypothetical protein [Candidatus Levybacteria bacterium]